MRRRSLSRRKLASVLTGKTHLVGFIRLAETVLSAEAAKENAFLIANKANAVLTWYQVKRTVAK